MYVPFLFGRENELLALRDLSAVSLSETCAPAVEAVRADPAALIRALDAMSAAGIVTSVIMNPASLRSAPSANASWSRAIRGASGFVSARPALALESTTTLAEVRDFAAEFAGRPITLVARSGILRVADVAAAVAGADVLVLVHHNVAVDEYDAEFGAGAVIRLSNSFIPQRTNAEYGADDWFSTGGATYRSAGRPGFGDYTVLNPAVRETRGGAPGAVVIHASFIDSVGALWVRHFLSDSVVQGELSTGEKLLEAVDKLQADRATFLSSPGMRGYDELWVSRRHTTLGVNKRYQISHHVYTALATIR